VFEGNGMGVRFGQKERMNLIIVSKFLKAPLRLTLRDPRVIASMSGLVLVIAGIGSATGYLLHAFSNRTAIEVQALRGALEAQQVELATVNDGVDRELNALALRLGELQAQSNRLNALGERLVRIGKIDDGEFDFTDIPALGGPEYGEAVGEVFDQDIRASLDAFASRLAEQSQQLGVLESLLLQRDVEASLLPAGRPVRTGYASSAFGMRTDPFTGRREFHRGIDFNGERGSDVLAVADGVVSFAGRHPTYGFMVDIDHGNGYMTRYAHNHANKVEPGKRVRAGEVIAAMGSTGRSTGVHVHFEVWHNDKPVNPHAYLKTAARG
jgi:murein DD-endopeptidase MepM/ murein hydrolase activator NlpD